jgi:hypothetical protein
MFSHHTQFTRLNRANRLSNSLVAAAAGSVFVPAGRGQSATTERSRSAAWAAAGWAARRAGRTSGGPSDPPGCNTDSIQWDTGILPKRPIAKRPDIRPGGRCMVVVSNHYRGDGPTSGIKHPGQSFARNRRLLVSGRGGGHHLFRRPTRPRGRRAEWPIGLQSIGAQPRTAGIDRRRREYPQLLRHVCFRGWLQWSVSVDPSINKGLRRAVIPSCKRSSD